MSIRTQSSLLQLLAEDMFTIFISRIADIIKPLDGVGPFSCQTQGLTAREILEQSYGPIVTNTHVSSIATIVVSSGIGSQEGALASIVPPLLQRDKLPNVSEVTERLLSIVKQMSRMGHLREGEARVTSKYPASIDRKNVQKSMRALLQGYPFAK